MKTYPKISQLLGICLLLQGMPLLLQAQTRLNVPLSPSDLVAPVLPVVPMPPRMVPVRPMIRVPPLAPSSPMDLEEQQPPLSPNFPPVNERALDVLDFWFGFLPGPAFFPREKMYIWMANSPEVDRQIREAFSLDMSNAVRGEYNNWRETPRGRLALILLLDQFPRHIYRNRPQAFAFDRMARALVLEGLQKEDDKSLYPVERAFFYLPLEHAEDQEMQDLSVAYYQQLVAEAPAPIKLQMEAFLFSALQHQQQIAHFGRFPYRNAISGRKSTPEEMIFLNQWGRPSF